MKSYLRNRFGKWLDKRIPSHTKFDLGIQSIFIFPSKFGFLYMVLCFGLFFLGTNYQNNLLLLLCYFLVAVMLINLYISYFNFARLSVSVSKVEPIHEGEKANVNIQLSSQNKAGQVEGIVKGCVWQEKHTEECAMQLGKGHVPITINDLKRGKHALPRITIRSYYMLGLFVCWTHLKFNQTLWVYPKPIPTSLPNLSDAEVDDEQLQHESHTIGSDEFNQLKAYQEGESLQNVAWKQYAKGLGLLSKEFNGVQAQEYVLSIPSHTSDIETALSHLTYQIISLHQDNKRYALNLPKQSIKLGSGSQQKQLSLQALASYSHIEVVK